jgi:hypothetical protein
MLGEGNNFTLCTMYMLDLQYTFYSIHTSSAPANDKFKEKKACPVLVQFLRPVTASRAEFFPPWFVPGKAHLAC